MKKYKCKTCNFASDTNENFDFTLEVTGDKQVEVYYICKECKDKEVK